MVESAASAACGITVADVLEEEQTYLMPMPTPIRWLCRSAGARFQYLSGERTTQPLFRTLLANHKIAVHLYPDRIDAHVENVLVACHPRCSIEIRSSCDWQHYTPLIERKSGALRNDAPFEDMPPPFAKLQATLRQHERQQGERLMAKVSPPSRLMALEPCWRRRQADHRVLDRLTDHCHRRNR